MGAFVGAYNKGRSPVIGPQAWMRPLRAALYVLLIAWGVVASGQLMDLALFIGIFGRASGEQLRHDPLLPRQAVRSQAYVYRL